VLQELKELKKQWSKVEPKLANRKSAKRLFLEGNLYNKTHSEIQAIFSKYYDGLIRLVKPKYRRPVWKILFPKKFRKADDDLYVAEMIHLWPQKFHVKEMRDTGQYVVPLEWRNKLNRLKEKRKLIEEEQNERWKESTLTIEDRQVLKSIRDPLERMEMRKTLLKALAKAQEDPNYFIDIEN